MASQTLSSVLSHACRVHETDAARTMLVLRVDGEASLLQQILAGAVAAELRSEVQRAPPAGVPDARRLPAAESPKSCLPACTYT